MLGKTKKLVGSSIAGVLIASAVLIAFSVYGMNFFAGRGATSLTSVLTTGPLELKLELQKTEFVQGEPINITVSLKNIGNTTITITFTEKILGGIYPDVYNASGTKVWGRGLLPQAIERITLEPNEGISRTYTWNQITIGERKQVPKGTYAIVGKTLKIGALDDAVAGRLEFPPFLETSPIIITIK